MLLLFKPIILVAMNNVCCAFRGIASEALKLYQYITFQIW